MAVHEQYGYNRNEEELDSNDRKSRKSQPRRIVDRKIATVALSRCGQRHLHGEDYL
jgi:hypothetical protein